MNKPKVNKSFTGPREFLSNFYPARVFYNHISFPTVEHAYVAAKTDDVEIQKLVSKAKNAAVAKEFGKHIPLRANALEERISIMRRLLEQKFREPFLQQQLMDTGSDPLVEYNYWHDNFWGSCTCPDCQDVEGENNLGKLLMQIRDSYILEEQHGLFSTEDQM